MLGFLKKTGNRLFEFKVPVTHGVSSTLDADRDAGFVICYAAAPDEDKAKQVVTRKIQEANCTTEAGWQSYEIPPRDWDHFVRTKWFRTAKSLPSQEQVDTIVQQGGILRGTSREHGEVTLRPSYS